MNDLSKTNQEFNTQLNTNFVPNLTSTALNSNLLSTSHSSIVFIDSGVIDYQSLVERIYPETEVHILSPDQNATAQITEILMGREGISSLHIISHGDVGGLQLGKDWLNVSNLNNYANQIQAWKNALTNDADILLYGCNVGAGTTGQAFVNLMSQLTGADIAASDNLTGNTVLGGDWDLEVKTGTIESVIALTTEAIQTYSSTLNLSFAAPINLTAGTAPWALSIGDINGDGEQDLAVANYISNNVSVLLGNGDGTFANPINFTAGDGPSGVSIGDINGDRQQDLVVTNFNGNNVSVLLGNGNATFAPPTNFVVASGSMDTARVEIGDINGDGKQDLAIVNYISSKILVLLGNGDGTFATPTEFTAQDAPAAVSIGDINGDGKQDLAVANYGYYGDTSVPNSNNISVLLSNGNGTFAAPVNFTAGNGPEGISIGDINGDGKQDLAVANYKSNNISVLLGNGNGTFNTPINFITGNGPTGVQIGDINGDGKQDLVVTNYDSNTISVLLNNQPQAPKNITLSSTAILENQVGVIVGVIKVSDIDSRFTDITITVDNPNFEVVKGNSSFFLKVKDAKSFDFEDINGNSFNIQITAKDETNLEKVQNFSINILDVNEAPTNITLSANTVKEDIPGQIIGNLIVTDPDANNSFTFVVDDNRFEVIANQLQLKADASLDYETNSFVNIRITAIDQDNLKIQKTLKIKVLEINDQPIDIILSKNEVTENSPGEIIASVILEDVDSDIFTLNVDDKRFEVIQQSGTFVLKLKVGKTVDFKTEETIPIILTATDDRGGIFSKMFTLKVNDINDINKPPIQRRKHDFDGDGKADILWRDQITGENAIWRINDFQLRDAAFITPVPDPNWKIVTTGDFNGDGKADILWRNYLSGENAIWMMDGFEPLSAESRQFITRVEDINWKIITAADFNGDSKSDILWRNSNTGENAVWLMNGFQLDGQFLEYRIIDTNWVMVDAGDFDADGKADIVWRNSKTGENAIWLMNGSQLKDAKFLPKTDLNWKMEKVGDLNGDTKDDIVWRNYKTGEMAVWFVDVNQLDSFNNYSVRGEFIAIKNSNQVFLEDTNWKLEAITDYNGDAKYDLIWRNYINGKTAIWWMDSHQIVNFGYITQSQAILNIKTNWEITF
ncbi:Integrins alpha chain [Calothrix sp. NIES-4101]|nr:Integrins alpha chain [Calothrix sp. NIES-4101]